VCLKIGDEKRLCEADTSQTCGSSVNIGSTSTVYAAVGGSAGVVILVIVIAVTIAVVAKQMKKTKMKPISVEVLEQPAGTGAPYYKIQRVIT
jgi:hypothetical protein